MMELVKHSIGLPSIYNQTDLSLSSGSIPYNQWDTKQMIAVLWSGIS